MEIYIVAVLVFLVLTSTLFFALRSTVKRIDNNTKKYFVDKLQDYDYLIEEKNKILSELNKEIEENKKILSKIEQDKKNGNDSITSQKYYEDLKEPELADNDIFKKYKKIKQKFKFNTEDIIKEFVSKYVVDSTKEYKFLMEIRSKFSSEIIFKLMNMNSLEQEKFAVSILDERQIRVLNRHIKLKKFNINKFISKLNTLIELYDPVVYVITGDRNKNYNYLFPFIKTVFDEKVNEGVKISYKGKVYDYSL